MMTENMNNDTKDSFIHRLASEFVGKILTNYLLPCVFKRSY